MTKDNGYETIVPDSTTSSDELLLAQLDHMISYPDVFHEDDFKRVVAEHRQAAYSQALKDAAEVVGTRAADLKVSAVDWRRTVKAILSLGDKSNG